MSDAGGRDDIDRLADRVMRTRDSARPTLPSPDLCTIALALARALSDYEAEGGQAHRDDVLRRDEFRAVIVRARSKTGLPRPEGRWEIALGDGSADEWVIGEAGGGWLVEGLERLTGGTPPGLVVGVDDRAPDGPPPPQPRSRRRRTPVGWFRDPSSRFDLRYFDGAAWTRFVVDASRA